MCEEFGCLPSALDDEDPGLLLTIMEYRAYAQAKNALEQASSEAEVPRTSSVEDVWMVQHELLRRRNAARKKEVSDE